MFKHNLEQSTALFNKSYESKFNDSKSISSASAGPVTVF